MAINFLLSKIASYPSRTVLFENFFCVVAVLYLVYNLESWVPYLDIIKGIWGEKLFAAAATPPSCHIQSPKEKRARINFASYLLAMLQKIIFAAGGVAFQYQRKKCKVLYDLSVNVVSSCMKYELLDWMVWFQEFFIVPWTWINWPITTLILFILFG